MNIELIKSELEKLSFIILAWKEGETVSAIERDMALDKLKSIYDILRFGLLAPETPEMPETAITAAQQTVTAPAAEATATEAGGEEKAPAHDESRIDAADEDAENEDAEDVEVEFIFAEDDTPDEDETVEAGYDEPEDGTSAHSGSAAEDRTEKEQTAEEPVAAEPAPENTPEPDTAAEPAREIGPEPEPETPTAEPEPETAGMEDAEPAQTVAAQEIPAEQPAVTYAEPAQPAQTAPAAETVIDRPAPTAGTAASDVQPATAPAAHDSGMQDKPAAAEEMTAVKPAGDNAPQQVRRPMNSLFGSDDEIQSRPRTKHHRMMSIYDDAQPRPEKVVDISKIFEMDIDEPMFGRNSKSSRPTQEPARTATGDVRSPEPARETAAEAPRRETAVKPSGTAHTPAEPQNVTLGDTIAANTHTLADTLGKPSALAEEITHTKIDSLRQAIGINDKFLMIRDLFDGDGEAYEEAISALERFDSLDDCMIHIVENYAWNPDSQGAKFIMQLLERKLS